MEQQRIFFSRGKVVSLVIPEIEKDLERCLSWINDEEVRVYLGQNGPMTREQERTWFEKNLSELSDQNLTLGIWHNDQEKLIGMIGFHHYDTRDRRAATGTLIGEKGFRGKGLGVHAKMLFLNYSFNQLNVRMVLSHVLGFNERSKKYSLKCGYREVARIPDFFYRNGEYHDEIILAVYQNEWQEKWEKEKDVYLP